MCPFAPRPSTSLGDRCKIGNAVDQVLLYCYRYDPHTGRYSAQIFNILRLAAGATVLALVGFILSTSLRRGGRAQPAAGDAAAKR